MHDEFDLAEALWEVAEPALSDVERENMCVALHAARTLDVIVTAVRGLTRADIPLPHNVFDAFHGWLRTLPALDENDPRFPIRLALYLLASDVRESDESALPAAGRYGDATLCYFILEDAGAVDATHDRQAAALRHWLADNRPSPALRADFRSIGFGYLLDGPAAGEARQVG
jgi:hypothetical protein